MCGYFCYGDVKFVILGYHSAGCKAERHVVLCCFVPLIPSPLRFAGLGRAQQAGLITQSATASQRSHYISSESVMH